MNNATGQFKQAIVGVGLPPPSEILDDGLIHRFATSKKAGDESGWYVFHSDEVSAGSFGCWRSGLTQNWSAKPANEMTEAERTSHRDRIKAMQLQRESDLVIRQTQAADDADRRWNAAKVCIEHPYATVKGINLHGVRAEGSNLLIPLRDTDGKLWSLQTITPNGTKMFVPGGRVKGCYCRIVGLSRDVVVVAEGFATGASIHEVTGYAVVVAFNAGNLEAVALAIRDKHPDLKIIIAADDDYKNAGNPGLTKARAAAMAVNGLLVMPDFSQCDRGNKDTDFNDLYRAAGPEAVKLCFDNAQTQPTETPVDYPLTLSWADQLTTSYEPPDELVEGLLTAGDGSVLFGESNSGKTFLALDIACAVARGVPWQGRRVEQGFVLYLACESVSSVKSRLQAYQNFHNCRVPGFCVVETPIDLFAGDFDTEKVIFTIKQLERQTGQKVRLIVGDTLARLTAGGDENRGADMGLVVRRFDHIRTETNSHFMLIHHSGKNAANGARGWSGLRAAIDTELEVTDSPSGRCLEITKQRDLSTKGQRIGFKLESVTLGVTKWGEPATSCVVVSGDAPAKAGKALKLGETQQAVMALLRGAGKNLKIKEVAELLAEQGITRTSVYNAVNRLRDVELVEVSGGVVHLIGGKS